MRKIEASGMENVTGGDIIGWFDLSFCIVGCLIECERYGCTNPVTDCSVGCILVTL